MREAFHGELAELGGQLARMCGLAANSMERATRALLAADLRMAERVIASDAELDEARNRCEEHAHTLLALQAPVATDLRTILATIYCADKIERMGDLAAHIADITRFSHPGTALPPELQDIVADLGAVTVGMAHKVRDLITDSATGGFAELHHTDDIVDRLCEQVLTTITGTDWPHDVRAATNLALLARFYERFADQAVAVARRLEFATTGTLPGPAPR